MLHRALEQFLSDVYWGPLDYLLIDMPPGTGDVGLSLGQLLPRSEAVLVTTPQLAAQRVAARAAQMVEKLGQPLLGVIENMSSLACPCCGEATYPFGQGGGAALATQLGVPLLGEVPLEPALREGSDSGEPIFASDPDGAVGAGDRRDRAAHRGDRAGARGARSHRIAARSRQGLTPPRGGLQRPFLRADSSHWGTEGTRGLDLFGRAVLIDARDVAHALWEEVRNAMVEIDRPASLALCCLLAAGHLLVEDVPGVGKTTLAKVIARAIGGHDSRIQCTEDLTSTGVIGQEIESTNPSLRPDEFIPGPLFANAVVLDEFNRASAAHAVGPARGHGGARGDGRQAPPRPAAPVLLHRHHEPARQRRHVRAGARLLRPLRDAHRHRLPLRERRARPAHALQQRGELREESDPDRRARRRGAAAEGHRAAAGRRAVRAYLVRLLRSTREHPDVLVGASPRALLSMYRCAQAAALLDNAAEVAVKHVRSLFEPCIAHRIRVRPDASARAVCEEILERTPVPVTAPPPTIAANDGATEPGRARPPRRVGRRLSRRRRCAGARARPGRAGPRATSAPRGSRRRRTRAAPRCRPSVAGLARIAGAREQAAHLVRERLVERQLGLLGHRAGEQHVDAVEAAQLGHGVAVVVDAQVDQPVVVAAVAACRRDDGDRRRLASAAVAAGGVARREGEQQAVREVSAARLVGLGHRVDDVRAR